jgi:hypothetical protein
MFTKLVTGPLTSLFNYVCNPMGYTIFDDFIHNIQQLKIFLTSIVHLQEHSYAV